MMPQNATFPVPASRGDLLLPSTSPPPADTPCRPSGSPREAGTGIQPPNGTFETVSQRDASEVDVPSPRFTRGPAPSLYEPPHQQILRAGRQSGSPREAGTGIQPPNGTFETVSQHDASEVDVPSPRFTRGPAPSLYEPPQQLLQAAPAGPRARRGLGFNHLMGLLRQSHNMMPQNATCPVPASRGDLLLPSTSPPPADTPGRPSGSPREAGTGI